MIWSNITPAEDVVQAREEVVLRDTYSYLDPENAKNDEECTTDEDNVADGFEGSDESFHHQLQAWRSANHSEERRGMSE